MTTEFALNSSVTIHLILFEALFSSVAQRHDFCRVGCRQRVASSRGAPDRVSMIESSAQVKRKTSGVPHAYPEQLPRPFSSDAANNYYNAMTTRRLFKRKGKGASKISWKNTNGSGAKTIESQVVRSPTASSGSTAAERDDVAMPDEKHRSSSPESTSTSKNSIKSKILRLVGGTNEAKDAKRSGDRASPRLGTDGSASEAGAGAVVESEHANLSMNSHARGISQDGSQSGAVDGMSKGRSKAGSEASSKSGSKAGSKTGRVSKRSVDGNKSNTTGQHRDDNSANSKGNKKLGTGGMPDHTSGESSRQTVSKASVAMNSAHSLEELISEAMAHSNTPKEVAKYLIENRAVVAADSSGSKGSAHADPDIDTESHGPSTVPPVTSFDKYEMLSTASSISHSYASDFHSAKLNAPSLTNNFSMMSVETDIAKEATLLQNEDAKTRSSDASTAASTNPSSGDEASLGGNRAYNRLFGDPAWSLAFKDGGRSKETSGPPTEHAHSLPEEVSTSSLDKKNADRGKVTKSNSSLGDEVIRAEKIKSSARVRGREAMYETQSCSPALPTAAWSKIATKNKEEESCENPGAMHCNGEGDEAHVVLDSSIGRGDTVMSADSVAQRTRWYGPVRSPCMSIAPNGEVEMAFARRPSMSIARNGEVEITQSFDPTLKGIPSVLSGDLTVWSWTELPKITADASCDDNDVQKKSTNGSDDDTCVEDTSDNIPLQAISTVLSSEDTSDNIPLQPISTILPRDRSVLSWKELEEYNSNRDSDDATVMFLV